MVSALDLKITRINIVKAFAAFNSKHRSNYRKNWETGTTGNDKYAIVFKGKLYPVKEIIRIAASRKKIGNGGEGKANKIITDLGFEIVPLPHNHTGRKKSSPDEEDVLELGRTEGGVKLKVHRQRERSKELIKIKKNDYLKTKGHLRCEACNFDFRQTYPTLFKSDEDFIECHHLNPLSNGGTERKKTNLKDLCLLCSNCHRMIHRLIGLRKNKKSWPTVNEFKKDYLKK